MTQMTMFGSAAPAAEKPTGPAPPTSVGAIVADAMEKGIVAWMRRTRCDEEDCDDDGSGRCPWCGEVT
jgi:hypothetical protein